MAEEKAELGSSAVAKRGLLARFAQWSDEMPLGRAPLAMIAALIVSAPLALLRSPEETSTLDFWVFAQTHYDEYSARVKEFEREHPGCTVRLQLLPGTVAFDKLMSAFLAGVGAPDLVEVEIGSIGRFFTGRKEDIGFVDLTERLKAEGWYERIPKARFVPWSNRGGIYGVPHDLHPVVLLYRWDLLEKVGVDLEREVKTWDDFNRVFTRPGVCDLDGDGKVDRYAVMTQKDSSRHFRMLLLQRGSDFFDDQGNVLMDSPLAVDTLKFIHDWFWRYNIALPSPAWGPDLYGPMKEDRLYCVMAPDWFIGLMRKLAGELAGKWRARPLPLWEPGGCPTSTHGGTMIGITKQCENFELAWELLKFFYFDEEAIATRYEKTKIIAPYMDAWDAPVFHKPDDYVAGPPLGELLTSLGPLVPPVHMDKYSAEAWELMDKAVYRALSDPDSGIEAILHEAAEKMRARIASDRFRD